MSDEFSSAPRATADVAALVAAQTLSRPIVIGDNVPAAVVPKDYALQLLEHTLDCPTRVRGDFKVATAEAFNRLVAHERVRQSTENGKLPIFFSRSGTAATVQAVLNFNWWRDHLVTLGLRLSDPFSDWYRLNGQRHAQRAFALFLEERTHHVLKPEGAALLELARKFKANISVRYSSIIEQENGDNALEFIQTTEAGSAGAKNRMKVPNLITLGLPVWHGGEPVKFEARFGYNIGDDGKLALSFEILRLEELLSAELRGIVERIGKAHPNAIVIEGTNCPVPKLG